MRRNARRSASGFTLIELMVALVIVGVLIAIVIGQYTGSVRVSEDRQAQANLHTAIDAGRSFMDPSDGWAAVTVSTFSANEPALKYASPSVNPGDVSVAPAQWSIAYAVYSKAQHCFYAIDVESFQSPAIAAFNLSGPGTYYNETAGSLPTGCTASNLPASGWTSTGSGGSIALASGASASGGGGAPASGGGGTATSPASGSSDPTSYSAPSAPDVGHYAVFALGGLNLSNSSKILSPADQASVYSPQGVSCPNMVTIQGDLITGGTANLTNSCQVAGEVWAKGNTTVANSSMVNGNLYSTGNVTISNNPYINGDVVAGGTVTGNAGTATFQNAQVPAPPTYQLPPLAYNQQAWQQAGYTPVNVTNCSNLNSTIQSAASPQVITTNCYLSTSNNTTVNVSSNLALFVPQGASFSNRTVWQSTNGTHNLYLIANPSSCSSDQGNITFANYTSFQNLNVFVYAACGFSAANLTSFTGQIYSGGAVSIANNFSVSYVPVGVPGWPGPQ